MAGYSGTPLLKKLGVKENHRVGLDNAPKVVKGLLKPLPSGAIIADLKENEMDVVLAFATNLEELNDAFYRIKPTLKINGMVWLCWPKGKSKIVKSINREDVRNEGLAIGLVDVKVAAIDEDWSGLKFVYRLKDR